MGLGKVKHNSLARLIHFFDMSLLQKSIRELRNYQKEIAKKIVLKDIFEKPLKTVGGLDISFLDERAVTGCVIVNFSSMKLEIRETTVSKLDFPYIPTLLCFREGPPSIDLINSLKVRPDVFLINSHGLAHPEHCGCASYIGVLSGVATVGVAARKLCGEYDQEPEEEGEYSPLRFRKEIVGWILKSKKGCKPIFISPGHLVSVESSLKIAKECMRNNKFPEPLHLAHLAANEEKRKLSRLS